MSKSILVIDTPESCGTCPCFLEAATDCCGVNGKDIDSHGKPDWCPLRELPTKKPKVKYHGNGCFGINEAMKNSFNLGFNACINEILKGANWDE